MLWVKPVTKKKELLKGDLSGSCCESEMRVSFPGMIIIISLNFQPFKPYFCEGSGLIKSPRAIKVKKKKIKDPANKETQTWNRIAEPDVLYMPANPSTQGRIPRNPL